MIATLRLSSRLDTTDRVRVIAAAREIGFAGRVETPASVFRGPSSWIIEFVLAVPVATFLSTLASEFGKDAYGALKGVLQGLRPPPAGRVVIIDSEETTLTFSLPIDSEAARALSRIDWRAASGTSLVWEPDQAVWRRTGRALG